MNKRIISLFVILLSLCLLLCGCAKGNKYGLSYVSDGSTSQYYIHTDSEREVDVYVIRGIMMTEIDGESYELESAFIEEKITLSDILNSAAEDAEKERIQSHTYNDGSVEYTYDGFRLVVLNAPTDRNVYFIPLEMNYYSLVG